jgi:hypothetical protein
MKIPAGLVIALVSLTVVGFVVGPIVRWSAEAPDRPSGLSDVLWKELRCGADGGLMFGLLERTLLFAAFVAAMVPLVAAWYAFKLASKWEVWRNIIRLPEKPDTVLRDDWHAFLHAFGSWVLQRFWIGTALNTLLALCAALLSNHILPGVMWPR